MLGAPVCRPVSNPLIRHCIYEYIKGNNQKSIFHLKRRLQNGRSHSMVLLLLGQRKTQGQLAKVAKPVCSHKSLVRSLQYIVGLK